MTIESVDFFYLSMPDVQDIGDGSQDALLVRVRAGRWTGWGECEASPLTSIASWVAPMSHSACKPVSASALGEKIDGPEDVIRINRAVRENSFDLLQSDHTLSGVDMALWDLLGRRRDEPVYRLLDYEANLGRLPYASVLFGDTPEQTHRKAVEIAAQGFGAAKFGWGPFGRRLSDDMAHLEAARSGLSRLDLMIDAGTVFETVEQAAQRLPALLNARVVWFEEPFPGGNVGAYRELSQSSPVALAGGEGSHNRWQAVQLIDSGGIGFIQIDAGRIGGITDAHWVARYADTRKVQYVNHTFTSSLALSASLQPYAGLEGHRYCEYPIEPRSVARDMTIERLVPSADGLLRAPDAPGLGMTIDLETIRRYLVEVEIRVGGQTVFRSDASSI